MTPRVHLADPSTSGALVPFSLCRFPAVAVTDDPGRVTCKLCARAMRKERESIPDYIDDRWFIEQTRKPLPIGNLTRAQHALWRHVFDGCARLITESAEDPRRDPSRGPRAPFASVSDAFAKLVVTRLDGYAQASVGDPDRLKRIHDQVEFAPAPGLMTTRAQGQAELAAEAHRALAHAFDRDWDVPPVRADHCREMLILRLVGDRSDEDIVTAMLETRDVAVTVKTVQRINRYGFARAWEWLVGRGLIPNPAGRVLRSGDSHEDDMGNKALTDADLVGWKEIADALGVSETTAQEWARSHGLPVARFMGKVEARTSDLKAWRDARTEKPSAA